MLTFCFMKLAQYSSQFCSHRFTSLSQYNKYPLSYIISSNLAQYFSLRSPFYVPFLDMADIYYHSLYFYYFQSPFYTIQQVSIITFRFHNFLLDLAATIVRHFLNIAGIHYHINFHFKWLLSFVLDFAVNALHQFMKIALVQNGLLSPPPFC